MSDRVTQPEADTLIGRGVANPIVNNFKIMEEPSLKDAKPLLKTSVRDFVAGIGYDGRTPGGLEPGDTQTTGKPKIDYFGR